MQRYNDVHTKEARDLRIAAAQDRAKRPMHGHTAMKGRPGDAVALEPGMVFRATKEIRTVPLVKPRGMAQMKNALRHSVVWKAGTEFHVDARAAKTKGAPWFRVSVIMDGEKRYTGFLIESATYNAIELVKLVS